MVLAVSTGLTSRLWSIVDAMEIIDNSGTTDKELVVLWPVSRDCYINGNDVIDGVVWDGKFQIVSYKSAPYPRMRCKNALVDFFFRGFGFLRDLLSRKEEKMRKRYALRKDSFDYIPRTWKEETASAYYTRVYQELKDRVKDGDTDIYIKAFHKIRIDVASVNLRRLLFLNQYIERVQQILGGIPRENLVGMHVRRTDHTTCIERSPLYLFTDRMDRLQEENPDIRFFLATDDDDVREELKERYDDRVLMQKSTLGGAKYHGWHEGRNHRLSVSCQLQCALGLLWQCLQ